jgi:RNA polymerase sigma-70 factor (ECF subfamily)
MLSRPFTALAAPRTAVQPQEMTLLFEQVFTEMAPYVLRVLPRMGVQHADLDDVAQEVFLAVHLGLAGFQGRSQVRTWIYGICMRTCSNYRRKAHRRHERATAELGQVAHESTQPEQRTATLRELEALDRALDGLPIEQRTVFVLFEVEGLDMLEISAALACSKFTAYARLYAARKRVAAALRGESKGAV